MKFKFAVKDSLSSEEIEQSKRAVIYDGIASQIMGSLTSTIFLTSLAVSIGVPNSGIGLLAAVPVLGRLSQICSVYLIEKVGNRRLLTIITTLIARSLWLLVALVPFFLTERGGFSIILIAIGVGSIIGSMVDLTWNSWMRDLIPEQEMGVFFSRRNKVSLLAGILTSVVAAGVIDSVKTHYPQYELYGYSIIFTLGFFIGLGGLYFLANTHEPRLMTKKINLLAKLREPFSDPNFLKLMRFTFTWNAAVNLAAPFFTVYLITRLHLDLSWVIMLSLVSDASNIVFVRIWGGFADNHGNKSVLHLCGGLYLIAMAGWTCTTLPEPHFFSLPLAIGLHVLMGIALSGVNLATGNLTLKSTAQDNTPTYLASINGVNSIAAAIAPIIGGSLIDVISQYNLSISLQLAGPVGGFRIEPVSLENWDFFFGCGALIGLIALNWLSSVQEKNVSGNRIKFREIATELRYTGLRITSTPFQMVELVRNHRRRRKPAAELQ